MPGLGGFGQLWRAGTGKRPSALKAPAPRLGSSGSWHSCCAAPCRATRLHSTAHSTWFRASLARPASKGMRRRARSAQTQHARHRALRRARIFSQRRCPTQSQRFVDSTEAPTTGSLPGATGKADPDFISACLLTSCWRGPSCPALPGSEPAGQARSTPSPRDRCATTKTKPCPSSTGRPIVPWLTWAGHPARAASQSAPGSRGMPSPRATARTSSCLWTFCMSRWRQERPRTSRRGGQRKGLRIPWLG
mmetsp:Transcript_21496/g.81857  ORF Transcript_21496/g.81857 Transcript_21496/m.81857 type:complete len:249 (+) Transcript_21496:1929-2675(+)